jgi:hypothetical protein
MRQENASECLAFHLPSQSDDTSTRLICVFISLSSNWKSCPKSFEAIAIRSGTLTKLSVSMYHTVLPREAHVQTFKVSSQQTLEIIQRVRTHSATTSLCSRKIRQSPLAMECFSLHVIGRVLRALGQRSSGGGAAEDAHEVEKGRARAGLLPDSLLPGLATLASAGNCALRDQPQHHMRRQSQ